MVKSALREWGDDARAAGEKEVNQLHWRETFIPGQMLELTTEQQAKILQSHMFIGQKRTGETKARMVTGGNTQHGHVTKEELSSPTVSTTAVLLALIVNAHEGRDVAVVDIPNAFIQTKVDDAKDRVIIRITGVIVYWLVKVAPKVYIASYVATNSKGVNSLLVECYNAIYGTMVAGLLYYHKFSSSLKNRGFTVNMIHVSGTGSLLASRWQFASMSMTARSHILTPRLSITPLPGCVMSTRVYSLMAAA